jgi:hypothetical protein
MVRRECDIPKVELVAGQMPTMAAFVSALSYIDHEWVIGEGGSVHAEQWAEAFAFGYPDSNIMACERERAQLSIDQLSDVLWIQIVGRAISMRVYGGFAFDKGRW